MNRAARLKQLPSGQDKHWQDLFGQAENVVKSAAKSNVTKTDLHDYWYGQYVPYLENEWLGKQPPWFQKEVRMILKQDKDFLNNLIH